MSLKGVLIVLTRSSDPDREGEWRQWYDTVHIPHVMETNTPGLMATNRFENASAAPDEPRSLAIYEMDRDPVPVFGEMKARMDKRRAEGNTYSIDCNDVMHLQTYRRIY